MQVTRLDDAEFDWASGGGGAAAVRRIAEAAAEADGSEALNEAAVLTLANQGLSTDALLVAGRTEDPEGFAYLHGLRGGSRAELDVAVAPDARGHGLGGALVAAALELAGVPVTAWSHGNHPAAAAIAKRVGWRAVRELWVMRRPASEPVPAWSAPERYAIRPFRPGEDDAGFLAVNATAFDFHPEQGSLDQRGLDERKALEWFDPAGFLLAEDGDGVVQGFHWTKVHPGTPPVGEVYVIGVGPAAQGTGLGKALLGAGLDHLHGRGVDEVLLYVEGDNRAAIALYERYGFTHAAADTHVMYAQS